MRGLRFIPACAGNIKTHSQKRFSKTVHPRLRGEHAKAIQSLTVYPGSSPPARGTSSERHQPKGNGRFIPACAGNMS